MRRTHDVPLMVKAANLACYFPPWTVTREQWSSRTHVSISGVAIAILGLYCFTFIGLLVVPELMRLSGGRTCDGYMYFGRNRIQQR